MQRLGKNASSPTHRRRAPRALPTLLGGLAVLALLAPATSSASRGGAEAVPCPDEVSQVFLPFGDDDWFRAVPGGDFEGDTSGWTFTGGATVVDGTTPLGGEKVLSLPAGSTATTPANCLDGTELFSRMLARSSEGRGLNGKVLVEVIDPAREREHPIGVVRAEREWDVTNRFLVPFWWTRNGSDAFQYRFTALGREETQIDSVSVDPRRKH